MVTYRQPSALKSLRAQRLLYVKWCVEDMCLSRLATLEGAPFPGKAVSPMLPTSTEAEDNCLYWANVLGVPLGPIRSEGGE